MTIRIGHTLLIASTLAAGLFACSGTGASGDGSAGAGSGGAFGTVGSSTDDRKSICASGAPCGGACVDLDTDPMNCGACGNACSDPAATDCIGGVCRCAVQCAPGTANCDAICANGCETTLGDIHNCWVCGDFCSLPHATALCDPDASDALTRCKVEQCDDSHADCDGVQYNGCETNVLTDVANCGGCSRECAAGEFCVDGTCM